MIGILLPEGSGGFVDSAESAIASCRASAGAAFDVRRDAPAAVDPSWRALLCHGGQWAPWLRAHRVGSSMPVVMTDLVPLDGPHDPLGEVTMVDWQWDQAAYLAGVLAAAISAGQGSNAAGTQAVGLLAGPAVPTQRRIAAAYAAGVLAGGHLGPIATTHAVSFEDAQTCDRFAALLTEAYGCAVVAHTADSAGESGAAVARSHGAATIGFLEPLGPHAAVIDSDIEGVLVRLLDLLGSGTTLPAVYRAGIASGHLDLLLGDAAYATLLEPHRPHALGI